MRIWLLVFLMLSFAYSSNQTIEKNAEEKMFSCENNVCYICLGERTEERCSSQSSRGFIDYGDNDYTAFGRAGFVTEGCEVLANTYFPNEVNISELYLDSSNTLKNERNINAFNISNASYKMDIYHYLVPSNDNKRSIDIMQCHLVPL